MYLRKDPYTEEYLREIGLNDRQIRAVLYVKEKGRITNKKYQEITGVSRQMAAIELRQLVEKGVFVRIGESGRGVVYELPKTTNK